MKKILLASTALFAVSGAAAFAQVSDGISITGNAEMGVFGTGGSADVTDAMGVTTEADADQPLQFWQSIDLDIIGSGSTDGGLTFGFDLDLDEADNLGTETDDMGTTIFVSSDFGTVTMGDTDGALDRVMIESSINNPGSINDAETIHLGWNDTYLDGSGDGQIVRYDYTFDAFEFALSVEQHGYDRNDNGTISGLNGDGRVANDDDDLTWAIGFGYQFDFAGGSVDTGIGYQYSDNGEIEFEFDDAGFEEALTFGGLICTDVGTGEFDTDTENSTATTFAGEEIEESECATTEIAATGVSAAVTLDNGLGVAFQYTLYDVDGLDKNLHHTAIGAGYSFDAFTISGNYGSWATPVGGTIDGYGIAAGYDLGGGAELLFGYSRSNADDLPVGESEVSDLSIDIYSLGLSFSF